jgi:Skp family chaperone for outer membrane proteins
MQNNSNKLAVLSLIINAFLALAVIILFVRNPKASGETDSDNAQPVDTMDVSNLNNKGEGAVIVYYNSDSLNTKCTFIMDLQKEIMDAQKNAESKMASKQKEVENWQKKWSDKGPLLSSEEQQYAKEYEQKQMEMMQMQQNLEQELFETQNRLTLTGVTRIQSHCRDLALENGYDYVISYQLGGQFLFCNPKMDITDSLIDRMNADYQTTDVTVPADAETAE